MLGVVSINENIKIRFFRGVEIKEPVLCIHTLTHHAVHKEKELRCAGYPTLMLGAYDELNGLVSHILRDIEVEMEPSVAIKSCAPHIAAFEGLHGIKSGEGIVCFVAAIDHGDIFHGAAVAMGSLVKKFQILFDFSVLRLHLGNLPYYMDLYFHYIIIFCDFQQFCGNASLLFWEVLMNDDLLLVSKKNEPVFWEFLVKALLRAVGEKGEIFSDERT